MIMYLQDLANCKWGYNCSHIRGILDNSGDLVNRLSARCSVGAAFIGAEHGRTLLSILLTPAAELIEEFEEHSCVTRFKLCTNRCTPSKNCSLKSEN